MQECCKAAPRRARYWVIAAVVALAVSIALIGGVDADLEPLGPRTRAPR
jgi:hypothetical protein